MVVFTASSPGPDVFYITSNALSGKWQNAIAAWMGVLLATLIYVIATALGLSALFTQMPFLYEIVRWMGVLYLAYLGFLFLKEALLKNKLLSFQKNENDSSKKIFLKGFSVTALNPKLILFCTALLPQFVNSENGQISLQLLILGLLAMCVGQLIYGVYVVVFVLIGKKMQNHKVFKGKAWPVKSLNFLCGIIYISFSIGLLFWKRA